MINRPGLSSIHDEVSISSLMLIKIAQRFENHKCDSIACKGQAHGDTLRERTTCNLEITQARSQKHEEKTHDAARMYDCVKKPDSLCNLIAIDSQYVCRTWILS